MKSSLLISPPGAHETISISASQDFPFQLGFQPSTAGFQRHGSDLVILFPNGGRVILEDCFAGEGLLPVILLPDGREAALQELFGGAPRYADGGLPEYLDAAGENISGISRLEAIGTDQEQKPFIAEGFRYSQRTERAFHHAADKDGGADDGGDAETPPGLSADFDDRFVLYFTQGQGAGSFSITGKVQAAHSASVLHPLYGAASEQGWGMVGLNSDGSLSYQLQNTELLQDDATYVDYVNYLDAQGVPHRVQVVLNKCGDFDSCDAALLHTVQGETHYSYVSAQTCRLACSDGADSLVLRDLCGTAAEPLSVNTGAGNDRLLVAASGATADTVRGVCGEAFDHAIINMGEDDDILAMLIDNSGSGNAWGIDTARILMGAGDDSVSIAVTASTGEADGIYALAEDPDRPTVLDLGEGNNILSISAASADGYANGIAFAAVSAGAGADDVSISAHGSGQTIGAIYSSIRPGAGSDTLFISAEEEADGDLALGLFDSRVELASAAGDATRITISTTANGEWAEAAAIAGQAGSSIVTGAGNDALVLSAVGENSGFAFGTTTFAVSSSPLVTIDMGAGNDSLSISASGYMAYGLSGTAVGMGTGDDTVDIIVNAHGEYTQNYGATSSAVDLGEGNDRFAIAVHSDIGGAYGASSTSIAHSGHGNAFVSISAVSGGQEAMGFSYGSITTDDGNDSIFIEAAGISGSCGGVYFPKIAVGGGNDTVSIRAGSVGSVYGAYSGSQYGSIDLGSGNDTLSIAATSSGNNATAMALTTVTHNGAPTDVTAVTLEAAAALSATVMQSASIILDSGNSNVSISAESSGGQAQAVISSSVIDLGAGRDILGITAHTGGNSYAMGLSGSTVTHAGLAGDAADISISAVGSTWARAVQGSAITTGEGDDTLTIVAKAGAASGTAVCLDGGSVNLGGGHNEVWFSVSGNNATAMNATTLTTGGGADVVRFASVSGGSSSMAMQNSTLNLGAGDDMVIVSGGGFSNSTIKGGAGLDAVRFENGGTITLGVGSGKLSLDSVEILDLGRDGPACTVTLSKSVLETIRDSLDFVTRDDAASVQGLLVKGGNLDRLAFSDLTAGDWQASGHTLTHDGVTLYEYELKTDSSLLLFMQNGVALG